MMFSKAWNDHLKPPAQAKACGYRKNHSLYPWAIQKHPEFIAAYLGSDWQE